MNLNSKEMHQEVLEILEKKGFKNYGNVQVNFHQIKTCKILLMRKILAHAILKVDRYGGACGSIGISF